MIRLASLKDLYVAQLQDLYSAETQLLEALPKMAQAASHEQLRAGFEDHLAQTQNQVGRLVRIFSDLGEKPGGHVCEAMEGIVKEGAEIIEAPGDATIKDAALIASAQRVEHYEIAVYGTVRSYAKHLGLRDHAKLLETTLNEEGDTDKKLTWLAEGGVFADGINEEAEVAGVALR
jgi:ferritin-like metal-binding protein YciE